MPTPDIADHVAALRTHADTLGSAGKPASRQLLVDAAGYIETLTRQRDALLAACCVVLSNHYTHLPSHVQQRVEAAVAAVKETM